MERAQKHTTPAYYNEPRFVLIEDVETDAASDLPPSDLGPSLPDAAAVVQPSELPDATATPASRATPSSCLVQTPSPAPQSLTSSSLATASAPMSVSKKKGPGSASSKTTKRPKGGAGAARAKKPKSSMSTTWKPGSAGEESDNGPYCICRGPDDHRWMICCEACEDWFHGECIKMPKDIGESLIERFICPNCTTDKRATVYRKSCSFNACRKAARLTDTDPSAFCSDEHAHLWWERMIAKLPKTHPKVGPSGDQLTQGELMAVLKSRLGGQEAPDGSKLFKAPFSGKVPNEESKDDMDDFVGKILSDEEKKILQDAVETRKKLSQEKRLYNEMMLLVENAQERRRAAIAAGHFTDDICGYDSRLDTVLARDAFAAYIESAEGMAALSLCDAATTGQEAQVPLQGICDRKRCKGHSGWQKMFPHSIKQQIRDLDKQAAAVAAEEKVVREAAVERWKRKQTENNWVEVINDE
ncbi:hypothetical protein CDD81_849 [Ophiocordyceps australis]|uniref:PHD-type domain-containing protein n=1 Tax=Ophiocordyceps australis TaxID=1399860 RepID=A0A2C5XX41_9HYPO|nr:hypothetical protein CDD81_849 [Ophiocordyceps australis]